MFNFITKKSINQILSGIVTVSLEWIWILSYVLLLSDVYLHYFHD